MDEAFGQVPRALEDGAPGPEAFNLLLRLLSGHFDLVDSAAGYKKLSTFGVPNEIPFCDFSREFRVVVSAAIGTDRVLATGAELVLEVVRMAVNECYPSLMPTLYPGVMATEPRPFGTLDAMWLVWHALTNNETPAINGGKEKSIPVSSSGVRSSAPSGPRPAGNGRGQDRTLFQSPAWQTGLRNNLVVANINKTIPGCTDPWLDISSKC